MNLDFQVWCNRLETRRKAVFVAIVLVSSALAIALGIATWKINPWPTDAEVYYMPAARELPDLKYLSEIHASLDEERIKWLHGKEIHVLAIAWAQQLLNDTESLRPLMLVGIVSIFAASILLFSIARRFWGTGIALLVYSLFVTSFWPYLYILFAKHQTQGLALFLLSIFFIILPPVRFSVVFYLLAGVSMAASLYSSTVSPLYMPYLLGAAVWVVSNDYRKRGKVSLLPNAINALAFIAGFAALFVYVNYPDIGHNLKSYWDYVKISGVFNHFYYNQEVLQQWIPPDVDIAKLRGGWIWIAKYLWLVIPVVFLLYGLSLAFLIRHCRKNPVPEVITPVAGLILLSLSSPVLAEIKQVAQYGANYFTIFMGLLLVIGYGARVLISGDDWRSFNKKGKSVAGAVLCALLALHVIYNAKAWFTEVYPTRMVTTRLSETIKALDVDEIYTYPFHPLRRNFVDSLDPEVFRSVRWKGIGAILQPAEGYILVPPVSKDTIYIAANSDYTDFDEDLTLNKLMKSGSIEKYAVAGFPTLSSSLIWAQEEEILAYRYLLLGQFPKDKDKGKVWLLDAAKLRADQHLLAPDPDDLFIHQKKIRNIGSEPPVYIFKGYKGRFTSRNLVPGLAARMYKVGNPTDGLIAYMYRVDQKQPVWLPMNVEYFSHPVSGATLTSDPEGGLVQFSFTSPIMPRSEFYFVAIYRTGPPDSDNYYRIYEEFIKPLQ